MYICVVPIVEDAEEGGSRPQIASGIDYSQASDLLDTRRRNGDPRRAVVAVEIAESRAAAFFAAHPHITRFRKIGVGDELLTLKQSVRTLRRDQSRTQLDEIRSAIRTSRDDELRDDIRTRQLRSLLPFLIAIGIGGAARYIGIHYPDLLPLLPMFAAALGTDAFAGTNGDEVNGRSLDTGGGSWVCYNGNGAYDIQSNECSNTGDKSVNDPQAYVSGGSAQGDQYAQLTIDSTARGGPGVRYQTTQNGYSLWQNGATWRIYRTATEIGSATISAPTPPHGMRLEIVSDDLEGFLDTGSGYTSQITALNDTTYSTGFGGFFIRDTAPNIDDFEWGTLGGGTATFKGLTLLGVGGYNG